ncbi:MAG: hypothetical protein KI790_12010 [Cyclobacteriaceae bacterium]|nr:hypothetical protein [Cyclobacteriaceae bacterium HetDA_MAG_MS6]
MDSDLRELLLPPFVLGAISLGIIYFTRTLTDYWLKRKLIDNGLVNEDAGKFLNQQASQSKYASLKWGLIVFFSGIGLIIINNFDTHNSPLPYGILAVSASLGFLLYYFLMKRESVN